MEKTRMIFCVIQTPNKENSHVSKEQMIEFFSQFGLVNDIEIFSRKTKIKAFIEFNQVESAVKLIQNSPAEFNTCFGKMKLVHSDKEKIVQRSSIGTKTDSSIESLKNLVKIMQPSTNSTFGSKQLSNCYAGEGSHPQIQVFHSHPNFYRNPFMQSEGKLINLFKTKSKIHVDTNRQLDPQIYSDFRHGKLNTNQNLNTFNTKQNYEITKPQTRRRILFVGQINIEKVNAIQLLNLFSCFGNVRKVLVDKTRGYGFIVMQNEQHASVTFGILNNFHFFGKDLRLKFSEFASFSIKAYKTTTNHLVDYIYSKPSWDRFQDFLPYKFVLPNKVLKIERFPANFTPTLMQELFSPFHEAEQIIMTEDFLTKEYIMIAGFQNAYHSAEILSLFHKQRINECCLQFSFYENTSN